MEVIINVNKQMGGYTFNIPPLSRKNFKEKYPNAQLVSTIYIESGMNPINFENFFGPLKNKIVSMMLGLSEEDLKSIEAKFIDIRTEQRIAI